MQRLRTAAPALARRSARTTAAAAAITNHSPLLSSRAAASTAASRPQVQPKSTQAAPFARPFDEPTTGEDQRESVLKSLAQAQKGVAFPLPASVTFARAFLETSEADPHRDFCAIGRNNFRWTNREAMRQVNALSNGFVSCRLRPGHTIIHTLDNDAEALLVGLSASFMGIRVVPLPGASAEQLVQALEREQAEGVVLDPKRIKPEDLFEAIPELDLHPIGVPFASRRFPKLRNILQTDYRQRFGMITLRDVLAYELHPYHNYVRRFAMPHVSPSLGAVGGASQEEVLKEAHKVASAMKLRREDRICVAGSVAAEWALRGAIWPAVISDAMILVPDKENDNVTETTPRFVLQCLSKESPSVLVTTAEMLAGIANQEAVAKYKIQGIRVLGVVGGDAAANVAAGKVLGVSTVIPL